MIFWCFFYTEIWF